MKTGFVLPLLLGLASHTPDVLAQSAGTFTATGNMIAARLGHTATRLPDGRVLIAGGCTAQCGNGPAVTATAELYDPASGTFTATGSMTSARSGHTATLLPDGRVLIAGGFDGHAPTVAAELYDSTAGTFTAVGNMTMAANYGSTLATLLSGGFVLTTGNDAELYDPGMRQFTSLGVIDVLNGFAAATLLADGRVLLTSYNGLTELFDPSTGTFRLTSYLSVFTDRASLLANGKVLIAGGDNDPGPDNAAELYDPSTEVVTVTGSMTAPRAGHTMTLLPDGEALIAGGLGTTSGIGQDTNYLVSAELYDPITGLFASTGSMAAGRAGHTATLLDNGDVLIAGGWAGQSSLLASAELYHPEASIPAPVLLSLSGDGQGQGAIQHALTYQIASAEDPAIAGEYLSIYFTGLTDGSVIPPQVAIGGRLAEITFFGNVAEYPGLNQVNIRVPSGIVPGPAVPVRLSYLGRTSNEVTIGVH